MMQDDHQEQIQFFLTPPHPCSYLARNDAQTLFVDPRRIISSDLYQTLTDRGFRRSGSHVYQPRCNPCSACVATRIPVEEFRSRRTQRRVIKNNQDLRLEIEDARFSRRHYNLYARYISLRHADGDMYPASEDQFRSFLLSPWSASFFICLYQGQKLLSVAVTDQQPSGLSAIYTFFEPNEERRSLGVLSILQQIEVCRTLELPYLYLGYWVRDCAKMAYKTDFRPTELYQNNHWTRLD